MAILVALTALLARSIPSEAKNSVRVDLAHPYAIQLMFSNKPIDKKAIPNLPLLKKHRLYISNHTDKNGKTWYRLRLGFFPTAAEAATLQDNLEQMFPGNWVTRVSLDERKHSAKTTIGKGNKRGWMARLFGIGKANKSPKVDLSHPYAIQLLLSPRKIGPESLPKRKVLARYRAYVVPTERNGQRWYQLRLGFFPSAKEAGVAQKTLEKQFPGNWVLRVSKNEREKSLANVLKAVPPKPKPKSTPKIPVTSVDLSHPYALQLMLSPKPLRAIDLPKLPSELTRYRLYLDQIERNGKPWYQLRLGFFPTAKAAGTHQKKLEPLFPGNWVTRVSVKERKRSIRDRIILAESIQTVPQEPSVEEKHLKQLMADGRAAFTRFDYGRAIQLYTEVLEWPDNSYQQDAQELLGLAHERNRQLAHAKAEYKKYLALYPDSDGAPRVRQRLVKVAKLITAKTTWDLFGSFSQYYRYDVDTDQTGNADVLESSLNTDLDLNIRRRGDSLNLHARFSGDHGYDFSRSKRDSDIRITTAYLDGRHRHNPASGRIGRQTQTSGGVLGRFDGFTAGYRVNPWQQIHMVAGYPVDFSSAKRINTDEYFLGLNTDLGTFANAWDFNLYAIQQWNHSLLDRSAVGTEMRYSQRNHSLFGLMDYDVVFREFNTLLLRGNLTLPDKTTLNLMLDNRRTPVLTNANALSGQPETNIKGLEARLGRSGMRDLAKDRTPVNRTVTLGGSHPLNSRVRINADLTLSKLTAMPASGGVSAVPASGQEYFFSAQVIVNRLLMDTDVTLIGLRYGNTSTATNTSLTFNSRFRTKVKWHLNPQMRIDYRDNFQDQSKQFVMIPSVRANYNLGKRIRLELELGADWAHNFIAGKREATYGYIASFGYRASL